MISRSNFENYLLNQGFTPLGEHKNWSILTEPQRSFKREDYGIITIHCRRKIYDLEIPYVVEDWSRRKEYPLPEGEQIKNYFSDKCETVKQYYQRIKHDTIRIHRSN